MNKIQVKVIYSESGKFKDNKTYDLEEFEKICSEIVILQPLRYGYFKTKVDVFLNDKQIEQEIRIDLNRDECGYIHYVSNTINRLRCNKENYIKDCGLHNYLNWCTSYDKIADSINENLKENLKIAKAA